MPSENWKELSKKLGLSTKRKNEPPATPPPPKRPRPTKKPTKEASPSLSPPPSKPILKAGPTPVLALDTEMIMIRTPQSPKDFHFPARISIVNSHLFTVLDVYVRPGPEAKITDYLTQHSGIRPEHLKRPDVITLEDARERLKVLLKDRVLVGHALWNDMEVLGISHPRERIRDTARLRSLKTGKGLRKLRDIAFELLGMEIQSGKGGHDSVEDAKAAMMIYKKKKKEFEDEASRHGKHLKAKKKRKAREDKKNGLGRDGGIAT